jgi:aminoglycoside phosphotransferase
MNELRIFLDSYFKKYSMLSISGGATNADLFRILDDEGQSFILKGQTLDYCNVSLQNDKSNYEWLEGKVPVPRVIFYQGFENYEFLCMTEIQGQPLEKFFGTIDPREVIRRYADSLKLLHSLKIDQSAFIQNLDSRLEKAKYNLDHELVNISELQTENKSLEPKNLFEKLLKIKPSDSDLVFTHGDYCFDNLIYNGSELTGFIDIGNGGVADRYQDIALAIRNIQDEFDDELVNFFCEEYGIDQIDMKKVEFYTLLDEFF